jgi:hypothetical protein
MFGSTGTTTFVLAALLVALGVAMIATTVWLVRATRTDTRALGPLEVMGDRRWHRADADRRSRTLDAARPLGAPPSAPMIDADPAPSPERQVAPEVEPVEEPVEVVVEEPIANGDSGEREPAAHSSQEDPQPAETA